MTRNEKKKIVGIGALAAAGFFIAALLVACVAMSGDGGLADDRIADIRGSESERGSGDVLAASSVTSNINYQGRLTDSSGNPLSGTYTVTFKLYETATGGTALVQDTNSVTVTDGLFSTTINLGTKPFDGRALWLGITVGADPEMTPRQELMPVPYALSLRPGVEINGSSGGPILEVINSRVSSGWPPVKLPGDGIYVKTFNPNSAAIDAQTYLGSSYGVSAIAKGDSSMGVSATAEGNDSDGVYARTEGNNSYGVRGIALGNYSVGVRAHTTGVNSMGVHATTEGDYGDAIYGHAIGYNAQGAVFKAEGNYSNGVWAIAFGYNSDGVSAISENGDGVHGISNRAIGEIPDGGIGVYGEARTDTTYGTGVKGVGKNGVWGEGTVVGVYGKSPVYAGEFRGNVIISSYSTGSPVVELGEGLDYAEGFDVLDQQMIEPGSVLCIDSLNPGLLTVCDTPYDRKVVGIVTGAQGLGSGVRLGSDEFDCDVALAGRVYCNVDATEAAVEPGDFLTTSGTSGYAMKVTEHERAQGAILGKAMEPLEKGEKGQILVLVTLQ